jgi:hypothetical protein
MTASLASPLTGAAHTLPGIRWNLYAVAQCGIEQDLVRSGVKKKCFVVGKTERYLVIHGAPPTGDRSRAPN